MFSLLCETQSQAIYDVKNSIQVRIVCFLTFKITLHNEMKRLRKRCSNENGGKQEESLNSKHHNRDRLFPFVCVSSLGFNDLWRSSTLLESRRLNGRSSRRFGNVYTNAVLRCDCAILLVYVLKSQQYLKYECYLNSIGKRSFSNKTVD
jgi:hypothetical protein